MYKIFSLISLIPLLTACCTYNFQPASITYTDYSQPGVHATHTSTTY